MQRPAASASLGSWAASDPRVQLAAPPRRRRRLFLHPPSRRRPHRPPPTRRPPHDPQNRSARDPRATPLRPRKIAPGYTLAIAGCLSNRAAVPPPGHPAEPVTRRLIFQPSRSRVPAEPIATRVFKLGPTPQNVDVYLDGQRQFGYDVDHTTIAIPWAGVHVIEFKAARGLLLHRAGGGRPRAPAPLGRHRGAPSEMEAGASVGDHGAARRHRPRDGARIRPDGRAPPPRAPETKSTSRFLPRTIPARTWRSPSTPATPSRRNGITGPRRSAPQACDQAESGRELTMPSALALLLTGVLVAAAAKPRPGPPRPPPRAETSIGHALPSGGPNTAGHRDLLHPLLYPEVLLDSEGESVSGPPHAGRGLLSKTSPKRRGVSSGSCWSCARTTGFDPLLDPQRIVDFFNEVVKEEESAIAAIEARRRQREQETAARRQREARAGWPRRRPAGGVRAALVCRQLSPLRCRSVPERRASTRVGPFSARRPG